MTDLERFLAETTASGKIPGVSLAALRAGTRSVELYSGVRGVHDHAAVDAATVFEAASLTKPLVAYIALQLVEEGLLDLQQPLFEICGDYVPGDSNSRRIAAFHVLTHTSGLPNIVRDNAPLRTYFMPGERFSYGSSAFAWLQRAMETVSARPLEMLARTRVFGPLGMRHSSLAWQERFAVNHAQGHEWEGQPVPKRRVQTAQASWSLLTTASDYVGFVQACTGAPRLDGSELRSVVCTSRQYSARRRCRRSHRSKPARSKRCVGIGLGARTAAGLLLSLGKQRGIPGACSRQSGDAGCSRLVCQFGPRPETDTCRPAGHRSRRTPRGRMASDR